MSVKSNTLFHFTPKMEYLESIIENGFFPRYCQEDRSWLRKENPVTGSVYKKAVDALYPMICFCDIPLSKIDEHVKFYGEYGIGMTKEWGIENNLNPVWYISKKVDAFPSLISDAIEAHEQLDSKHKDQYQNSTFPVIDNNLFKMAYFVGRTITFVKPISGKMKGEEKAFDEESEWRFIPSIEQIETLNNEIRESKFPPMLNRIKELVDKRKSNKLSETETIELQELQNLVEAPNPVPLAILVDQCETEELKNEKNEKNELLTQIPLKFDLSDIRYLFVSNDNEVIDLIKFVYEIHGQKDETHLLVSKIVSLKTLMRDL